MYKHNFPQWTDQNVVPQYGATLLVKKCNVSIICLHHVSLLVTFNNFLWGCIAWHLHVTYIVVESKDNIKLGSWGKTCLLFSNTHSEPFPFPLETFCSLQPPLYQSAWKLCKNSESLPVVSMEYTVHHILFCAQSTLNGMPKQTNSQQ